MIVNTGVIRSFILKGSSNYCIEKSIEEQRWKQRDQLDYVTKTQVRDDGGMDERYSRGGEKKVSLIRAIFEGIPKRVFSQIGHKL